MSDVIQTRREGVLTQITLDRPDKRNALNAELVEALIAAVGKAAADGTRLLVLDGAGKSFCAGLDLGGLDEMSEGDLVLRLIRIETLLQTVWHLPFPTLALARGRVFGAGADLFCACSRRVAAPGTSFRMPGLGFGIVLGTRRLMARVGADAARSVQNETRTFDAAEAQRLGFATEVADERDWPPLIDDAARSAQTLGTYATRMLFDCTAVDTRAQDMAALVVSASRPGLKNRIRAYVDKTMKAAKKD